MNRIIIWFAHNPIAANLLMVAILLGGALTWPSIPRNIYPTTPSDMISISVPYPGASPYDVDSLVCRPIDSAISSIEGIAHRYSQATENLCGVTVQIKQGYSHQKLQQTIQDIVHSISILPDKAEPAIIEPSERHPFAIGLVVHGSNNQAELFSTADSIARGLRSVPDISRVQVGDGSDRTITISVPRLVLERYQLSLHEIANQLRSRSIDIPAGLLTSSRGDLSLRVNDKSNAISELRHITLVNTRDGGTVTLGQIANISAENGPQATRSWFDGELASHIYVYTSPGKDIVSVTETVRQYASSIDTNLPSGMKLTVWADQSDGFRSRMGLLVSDAISSLFLVFLVLLVFLGPRISFWILLTLPISYLGPILFMPLLSVSWNMISLFAMIVALGIVVDDSIIISENISSTATQGKHGRSYSVAGVHAVARPVVVGALITMLAFLPIAAIPGYYGHLTREIPIVIILVLSFSLLEALLILPGHLTSQNKHQSPQIVGRFEAITEYANSRLNLFIHSIYAPLLRFMLNWRYATLAVCTAVFMVSYGYYASGRIPTSFFPTVNMDMILANLEMPAGTSADDMTRILKEIESAAQHIAEELQHHSSVNQSPVQHIVTTSGAQTFSGTMAASHRGEVVMLLNPAAMHYTPINEVVKNWQNKIGEINDAATLSFDYRAGYKFPAISFALTAPDLDTLRSASLRLKEQLAQYPGTHNISDSFETGKPIIDIQLEPAGRTLGITPLMIANTAEAALSGELVQSYWDGHNDVKILISYPLSQRGNLADAKRVTIQTPEGNYVMLGDIASLQRKQGFGNISRTDGNPVLYVSSEVDSSIADAGGITHDLWANHIPRLQSEFPTLKFNPSLSDQLEYDTTSSLKRSVALVLLIIYSLLAILFRSYSQPLIIITAVPFGMLGAFAAHLLFNLEISIASGSGMIAVLGLVLNDSLLLVDRINTRLRDSRPLMDAIIEGAQLRFRSIFLLTSTTALAIAPLLLERSTQTEFLKPMVVTLLVGVIFSAAVTLLLVPVLYYISHETRQKISQPIQA